MKTLALLGVAVAAFVTGLWAGRWAWLAWLASLGLPASLDEWRRPEDTVMVVVAARDLDPGRTVAEEDLYAVQVPPRILPEGTFADPARVVDHTVTTPILANELVRAPTLACDALCTALTAARDCPRAGPCPRLLPLLAVAAPLAKGDGGRRLAGSLELGGAAEEVVAPVRARLLESAASAPVAPLRTDASPVAEDASALVAEVLWRTEIAAACDAAREAWAGLPGAPSLALEPGDPERWARLVEGASPGLAAQPPPTGACLGARPLAPGELDAGLALIFGSSGR